MTEKISDLPSPVALVDIERLDRNIAEMASKAKENGVSLRPHIKTHKCIEIGKKQIVAGACGITVSTPAEAQAFADAGFGDITYAVPLAPDKIPMMLDLSSKTDLKVLVDNSMTVEMADKMCADADSHLKILLKVNCGNNRAGVDPESKKALEIATEIEQARNLEFKGILAHAGHSYDARSVEEIRKIAEHEQKTMVQFAETLAKANSDITPETVSIGSTPTTRLAESFIEGITEIRPGNYVFYDYYQVALGSCDFRDVAFTVQTSIIGTYPGRLVTDAGATALSKDRGPTHLDKSGAYGKVFGVYPEGTIDESLTISSLSQEHGNVTITEAREYMPGDRFRIIPNHSCLTANLFDHYYVVQGDSVVDKWKIQRQRYAV